MYLLTKLEELFSKVDFKKLRNACIQRGSQLPTEFKQQVKKAVAVDDLLDVLDSNRLYCNWLNIRILKRIVKMIDIQEAKYLIQCYEKCVYSKKVSDVATYFRSEYFKESHVSLVNTKIVESTENLTVADIVKYCEKLECNMGLYAGSVTATGYQPGCLRITCVIPMQYTLHAYLTAKANFLQFRQFHIHYIEIELFPKIYALKFSDDLDESKPGKLIAKCNSCNP